MTSTAPWQSFLYSSGIFSTFNRRYFSVFMRIIFSLLFVASLSACGGGGSSGGLSLDTPGDTPKAPPSELVPDADPAPGEQGQKVVVLEWDKPDARENGEYLENYEIGGYEIRYRTSEQEDYEVVTIEDGSIERYEFADSVNAVEFEIAAYDTDGLYSVFVPLNGREEVL